MDFKGWKVKSADGKKAVMVHDNGHFMSIAMKSLSQAQQQQIKRLADGGAVDSQLDPDKVKQFQSGFSGHPAPQPTPAPKPQMYAEGTPDQPVAPDSRVFPAAQQSQLLAPDQTLNPVAGLGMEQQAAQEQESVDAAKAKAMAPVEGGMAAQQQQLYNGPDDPNQLPSQVQNYREYHKHADEFNQYVQEHDINPRHFQESMGSGQKANTAIGLLLGGMAGGLSGHGGNVAADFLNKQIDRDIAAQQQNVNNRHTVLGAYENLYGQGVVAQNLARATMMDIYAHKVRQVAASLGTKQAHASSLLFQAEAGFKREQALRTAATIRGTANVMGQPLNTQDQSETPAPPPGASNIMSNTLGGNPTTPEQPAEVGGASTMLLPDAEHQFKRLQSTQEYFPAIKSAMPAIERSYSQARQAERSMHTISEVFPHLTKERSLGQYLMSNLPGSDAVKGGAEALAIEHGLGGLKAVLPAVGVAGAAAMAPEIAAGTGLAAAAGSLAYRNPAVKRYIDAGIKGTGDKIDQMKQYNADKVRIEEALLTSFPNMGEHERAALVKKVCPQWGDSAGVLEKKASHLKSIFKSMVDTAPLEVYHLMPGRLKK